MAIRRISVEDKVGAISAFAKIDDILFGLSAGHVLTGNDNHLDRNERVQVFEDVSRRWLPAGISNLIYFSRGADSPPHNFGTLDGGIFSLADEFRSYVSNKLITLRIHPAIIDNDFNALLGMRVFSYSVMYRRPIAGTIAEVFSHSNIGNRYDLIIDSDDNDIITTKGDSGILWYDINRTIVGMHTNGNLEESTASYATLINRVINLFDIQILYALESGQ